MSFNDAMNIMMPSENAVSPHVTGDYGEDRANGPHGGVDFNYEGGQTGIRENTGTPYLLQKKLVWCPPIWGQVLTLKGN